MSSAENSTADELIPKNPCSIKGAGVEKSAERRSQRWIRWLDQFVVFDADAFVFRGANGALPRRSNWSVLWRRVAIEAGVPGFRFHDLRHTRNTLAASIGASTKELMSRMGHESPPAALIWVYELCEQWCVCRSRNEVLPFVHACSKALRRAG